MKPNPVVIVAMDVANGKAAIDLASRLDPKLCRLKVGMELFTAEGPAIVEILRKLGFDIFLDLKFHDIPTTVAGAIRSAANLGVWMVNVHTLGGRKMMEAAVNAVSNIERLNRPIIIGVTPGIRLSDGNQDDQARIVTPEIAIQSGANYLVVGRPITGAPDPIAALQEINQCIASVQS